ncbi:peptide synthase, partial [Lasius niger]
MLERLLVQAWAAVFESPPIGLDDDFFALGGDSLKAARLAARISATTGIHMPIRAVFDARTLVAQARWISQHGTDALTAPNSPAETQRHDHDDAHPLSPAQEGLYFEWQLDPTSTAYHVSVALRIHGEPDPARLRQALTEVCADHDALRVRFDQCAGKPYQICSPAPRFDWHTIKLDDLAADRDAPWQHPLHAIANRPFDLHGDALLRAALVQVAPDEQILQLTMHHIITDAASFALIVKSLFLRYEASTTDVAQSSSTYFACIERARQALDPVRTHTQLAYWQAQLGEPCPELGLPFKHRSEPHHATGARRIRQLPASLVRRLDALAGSQGATLPMTLLAAFAALLYR